MSDKNNYYRALFESIDCGVKRIVVFHDTSLLSWERAGREACKHMYSQTCVRCNKNHAIEDYYILELEVGRADQYGTLSYQSLSPYDGEDNQLELNL